MNRIQTILTAMLWMSSSAFTLAQITYEGTPWSTGTRPDAISLPAIDREALAAEDAVTDRFKEVPWRFGVEHTVRWDAFVDGAWTLEQGHAVWRLVVRAEEATSLSLRFQEFQVPKGGSLFLYSSDGMEVLGALDHRNVKDWGGLATGVLATDELVVEYRQAADLEEQPRLVIDQVVQGYRSLSGWPHGSNRGPFGNSGACNINVNCPEGATWATEKRSVALIVQGGFAVCSGALVNNTLNDGTPYFLTANHCLGNPGNWLYYFNHESASCSGSTGPTNQSISSGTLLVNSNQSDVALIELSQTPPANFNVQYAGWDASGDIPDFAVGIHHPSGDVKKICFEDDSPYPTTGNNAQVWWIDQWELGVTEPGSSGSPLFDQNHRIIGQLFGGSAACSGSVNNGQPDFYGRFDVSWGLGLQDYLDPTGTGLEVWDGFPDGAVSFNNDAGINITGFPEGVLCGVETVVIEVTLTNSGENTLTSCMIEYSVNGGEMQSLSWAGTLEQGETEAIELPDFMPQGGTNTVEVNVITPNGVTDENDWNNSAEVEFTTYDGPTFNYTLTLVLDDFGSETTWTLKRLGQTLYEGGPYADDNLGQVVTEVFCLEDVCYQFRIADSYGDGMCCDWGDGSWTLTDPNGEVVGTGGAFGNSEQIQFCPDESLASLELESSKLLAFPNPACTELNLVWPEEQGEVRVLDVAGREVMHQSVFLQSATWNTSEWAQGTYLIHWTGASGVSQVARISIVR